MGHFDWLNFKDGILRKFCSRMYRSRMRFVTQSLFRPRVWRTNQIAESSLIISSRNISSTNHYLKMSKKDVRKKRLTQKDSKQEIERFERAAREEFGSEFTCSNVNPYP